MYLCMYLWWDIILSCATHYTTIDKIDPTCTTVTIRTEARKIVSMSPNWPGFQTRYRRAVNEHTSPFLRVSVCDCGDLYSLRAAAVPKRLVGKIICRFEERGYKLTALKLKQADEALLKTHYKWAHTRVLVHRVTNSSASCTAGLEFSKKCAQDI